MSKTKKIIIREKTRQNRLPVYPSMVYRFPMVLWKGLFQAIRFSLSKMEMSGSGGYTLKFVGLSNFKFFIIGRS